MYATKNGKNACRFLFVRLNRGDYNATYYQNRTQGTVKNVLFLIDELAEDYCNNYRALFDYSHYYNSAIWVAIGNKERPVCQDKQETKHPHNWRKEISFNVYSLFFNC